MTQHAMSALEAAQKILDQDPPREAVKRKQGNKYLEIGDCKAVMKDAFGLSYSNGVQLVRLEVYAEEVVNKRSGEVKQVWSAWAIAHARIQIGQAGCFREGLGGGEASNQPTQSKAATLAAKAAGSDAFKRAGYGLGKRLGLGFRLDDDVEYGNDEAALAVDFSAAPDQRVGPSCETGPALEVDMIPFGMVGGILSVDRDLLDELASVPDADPVTYPVQVETHQTGARAVGADEAKATWRQLGVELRKGVKISGQQARQFLQVIAARKAA